VAPSPPPLEFDALDAAADQAEQLHLDLCPVWDGLPCSCGIPGLIVGLRDWVLACGLLDAPLPADAWLIEAQRTA